MEQQTTTPQPEAPQTSDQVRQKEEDALREEIKNLQGQIDKKNKEIKNLNAKVKELEPNKKELETLKARLVEKEEQINKKNQDNEVLQTKIKETVGYANLQNLETIFNETEQGVLDAVFAKDLGLVAIKQRINEQVRAIFAEKHKIEVEALEKYCADSIEECKRKINGLEDLITGMSKSLTDEFGSFNEGQRATTIAAIASFKEKKEEQETLQGHFIKLQKKLTNAPAKVPNVQKKKSGK